MNRLKPVNTTEDIPLEYRGTPIGLLLEYHNLGKEFKPYQSAELLIGMCMDNRKHLNIPDNFSFIIRSGGANLRYSEFKVSFALAIGGVRHIALIGHTQCGMVNLHSRREKFIEGLVSVGWTAQEAEMHFMHFSPIYEIGNETDFIRTEVKRISLRYPKVQIAPMLYKVEDNRLYMIEE